MSTKTEIEQYLLANPVDRSQPNPYVNVASRFGVHPELIEVSGEDLETKGR